MHGRHLAKELLSSPCVSSGPLPEQCLSLQWTSDIPLEFDCSALNTCADLVNVGCQIGSESSRALMCNGERWHILCPPSLSTTRALPAGQVSPAELSGDLRSQSDNGLSERRAHVASICAIITRA
jgi:hypothetical protein